MSDPRLRKHNLLPQVLLVTALGAVLVLSFGVVSGFAADKATETAGSAGSYHWLPNTAEVDAGGTVEFKNTESIPHGVVFESPPSAPSCPGVPGTGTPGTWSGTCTFTQAGTYHFYCPVHPVEMTGTITVASTGPEAPIVTTEPATGVNQTEATLNGKVNPSNQATTYWFKYGTSTNYDHETTHESAGAGGSALPKSAGVNGLTASTTYHFQLVAENGIGGLIAGADRTFTTPEPPGPPTATTEPASGVGSIEATLKGTVNPKGLSTEYFFKYGTSTTYDHETSKKTLPPGAANVAVSQLASGLSPETTYHFQLVAKNSVNETKGADQSFTTKGGPVATTGQATGVTEAAAKVEGVVNPQGQPTSYFFNYGSTTSYGLKTAEKSAGAGISDFPVSEALTGLAPGTTYHFQLVAKNSGGTSPGADQVFTTAAVSAQPPPPVVTPVPVIPPPPVIAPPDTKITSKPPAKTHDRTPTIKFSATGGSATFTCSVDSKAFKPCRSPFTAPSLKPGKHKISVKATVAGVADPTPASCSFKILAAKK